MTKINRRNFNKMAALGIGGLVAPLPFGAKAVSVEAMLSTPLEVAVKKELADAGLNTATKMGATYADVRIGRYLNQYLFSREDKVQNVENTESFGCGIRVIANGTWGFASTNDVSTDG